MKPQVLQLNPILIPSVNEQLAALYTVHKFFELPDQATWLREHGSAMAAVITGGHTGISRAMLEQLPAQLNALQLRQLQAAVLRVHVSEALLDYVQDLVAATRSGRWFVQGLSPRAGIAVLRAARAQALLNGRDYVAPDDVQAILPQTIAHRLVPLGDSGRGALEQVLAMLQTVPLP